MAEALRPAEEMATPDQLIQAEVRALTERLAAPHELEEVAERVARLTELLGSRAHTKARLNELANPV
jgi:hypothetical protein